METSDVIDMPLQQKPKLTAAWELALDDEVLDLLNDEPDCPVAQDCIRVMLSADAFIALLSDADDDDLDEVRNAAARQCAVFFYG